MFDNGLDAGCSLKKKKLGALLFYNHRKIWRIVCPDNLGNTREEQTFAQFPISTLLVFQDLEIISASNMTSKYQ